MTAGWSVRMILRFFERLSSATDFTQGNCGDVVVMALSRSPTAWPRGPFTKVKQSAKKAKCEIASCRNLGN